MEKQKSVVEFLKEKLEDGHLDISNRYWNELLAEANVLQKKQSEDICINVIERILDAIEHGQEINSKEIFEQYYNENFKSE